jgi:RNA recognition motif-containing protein
MKSIPRAHHPRVFVAQLVSTVNESALREFFEQMGCVVRDAMIVREPGGQSKNFGFLELETVDDFNRALSLDGFDWNSRFLVVRAAVDKISGIRGSEL